MIKEVYVVYDGQERCMGVFDYAREAAVLLGVKKDSVYAQMCKGKGNYLSGLKCVRVPIDEEAE